MLPSNYAQGAIYLVSTAMNSGSDAFRSYLAIEQPTFRLLSSLHHRSLPPGAPDRSPMNLQSSSPIVLYSVPAGDEIRSGVHIMTEDIIAVHACQGREFRQQLQDRYLASRTLQNLCWEMDLLCRTSGTIVGAGATVALFVVPGPNVAFILGESQRLSDSDMMY